MMKIKVLHVVETIGSGGVERRRLSLAKLLDKNIFEQKIICQRAVDNIGNQIRKEGVEVLCLNNSLKNLFDFKQHKAVQNIIEEYQPDIVHGAVFEGVTMAAINGWLKNVPIIIIEETSDPQNRSWRGNFLMKIFSKLSHKVIGVSPGVTEEYLKGKLNLPSDKVMLINNGVAAPRNLSMEEISETKKEFGIREKDFVIGSIGRMKNDHHKRYSDMLKAFAIFSENKNDVKLLLVGGNEEYLKKYKDLANELNISHNVIFAGFQEDVTLFYGLMDVFSLVSAYEAFGLVLAEAMLNKLPIVATNVGGMKYIVNHYGTGFLVEPFDIDDIARKYEILYLDPILRKKMGILGFEKAVANYTEKAYVENVMQMYMDLYHRK